MPSTTSRTSSSGSSRQQQIADDLMSIDDSTVYKDDHTVENKPIKKMSTPEFSGVDMADTWSLADSTIYKDDNSTLKSSKQNLPVVHEGGTGSMKGIPFGDVEMGAAVDEVYAPTEEIVFSGQPRRKFIDEDNDLFSRGPGEIPSDYSVAYTNGGKLPPHKPEKKAMVQRLKDAKYVQAMKAKAEAAGEWLQQERSLGVDQCLPKIREETNARCCSPLSPKMRLIMLATTIMFIIILVFVIFATTGGLSVPQFKSSQAAPAVPPPDSLEPLQPEVGFVPQQPAMTPEDVQQVFSTPSAPQNKPEETVSQTNNQAQQQPTTTSNNAETGSNSQSSSNSGSNNNANTIDASSTSNESGIPASPSTDEVVDTALEPSTTFPTGASLLPEEVILDDPIQATTATAGANGVIFPANPPKPDHPLPPRLLPETVEGHTTLPNLKPQDPVSIQVFVLGQQG